MSLGYEWCITARYKTEADAWLGPARAGTRAILETGSEDHRQAGEGRMVKVPYDGLVTETSERLKGLAVLIDLVHQAAPEVEHGCWFAR